MRAALRPRWAKAADAAAILEFNSGLAVEAPQFLVYDIDPGTGAEMLQAKLGDMSLEDGGDGVLVVADGADAPLAGVLLLRRHRHPAFEGVLQLSLAVRPEWRGMGVGRRLLDHAAQAARTAGARRLQLAVVAENAAAVRLFQGAGFVEEGRLREAAALEGRRLDVLVMARML